MAAAIRPYQVPGQMAAVPTSAVRSKQLVRALQVPELLASSVQTGLAHLQVRPQLFYVCSIHPERAGVIVQPITGRSRQACWCFQDIL